MSVENLFKVGEEVLFKVGDKAWCQIFGWGYVACVTKNTEWTYGCVFGDLEMEDFDKKGAYIEGGPRALFHEEIPIPESALIRPEPETYWMVSDDEKKWFKCTEKPDPNHYQYINLVQVIEDE